MWREWDVRIAVERIHWRNLATALKKNPSETWALLPRAFISDTARRTGAGGGGAREEDEKSLRSTCIRLEQMTHLLHTVLCLPSVGHGGGAGIFTSRAQPLLFWLRYFDLMPLCCRSKVHSS